VKLVEPTRNPLGTPQHPGGTPSPGSYGELQPLQRLPTSSVPQQKRRWRCYWMPLAVLQQLQHGCGPGQRHLPGCVESGKVRRKSAVGKMFSGLCDGESWNIMI